MPGHKVTKPVAPPVYRPQPTPKVLQRKAAGPQQKPTTPPNQPPVFPPVYRPQSAPGVLQAKEPLTRRLANLPSPAPGSPRCRPQTAAQFLQRKTAQPPAPRAGHPEALRKPVAPSPYRPQPLPKVLQTKAAVQSPARSPSAAPHAGGPTSYLRRGPGSGPTEGQGHAAQGPRRNAAPYKPAGTVSPGPPRPPGLNNGIQMLAGVESFTTIWHNDDRGGTGAGYRIEYRARFKDGNGYTAGDAEFRQHAYHKWRKTSSSGHVTQGEDNNLPDDGYSRANDPGDYNGQDFTADDLPGFAQGTLAVTDDIEWVFKAEQYIVDTSAGNEVIAYIPTQMVSITGAHPRTFSPLPQVHPAVIRR